MKLIVSVAELKDRGVFHDLMEERGSDGVQYLYDNHSVVELNETEGKKFGFLPAGPIRGRQDLESARA